MPKETVDFSESALASAVAAAKSKKIPVGGVAMPSIPRLDQPPPGKAGEQSLRAAQKVLTPEQQQQLRERGQMREGVGSAYEANQPMAFAKPTDEDGNVKDIDPRLEPRPPGSGLRPQTLEQLEAVVAANKEVDKDLASVKDEIDEIEDSYETDEFGDRVRGLLHNKKRRAAIESRCPMMLFEDLLINGFVEQKVPIIPVKFEPTFRSLLGNEDVEIKRLMGSIRGPDQYVLDTFSLYNLTAGLYAINGKLLPNHLDKNGDFDEKLFKEKYKVLTKMAIPILADLSVNFTWFTNRVQKLTVIDDIKGF
jgi:hypothetical protein